MDLDSPEKAARRHLVIILDGVGYEVVQGCHKAGGLRLLHPPSRVIAPYPTLTDLALEDALGYVPCRAFEAKYYDRARRRVVGGSWAYLCGANQPYNRLLDYRAKLIWDALGYVAPWTVFRKEVKDLARQLSRTDRPETLAYLVSSAGIGTASGAEGQRRALGLIDRLILQAVSSARGSMAVTLLSDHGHSYTPGRQIRLDRYLKAKGWRLTHALRRDRDVAYVRFGLETYASFGCLRPADLAADLAECAGVTIVSYAEGDSVVVLSAGGKRAVITKKHERYRYDARSGDPLKLLPALALLQQDGDGFYDDRQVLAATAEREYPDALERLWRAHFAMVECTPDVIASLADEFISGAAAFGGSVKVASTHGSLNRANSTTFIMSSLGPLPPLMRSADIPAAMAKLLGRSWPMKKS